MFNRAITAIKSVFKRQKDVNYVKIKEPVEVATTEKKEEKRHRIKRFKRKRVKQTHGGDPKTLEKAHFGRFTPLPSMVYAYGIAHKAIFTKLGKVVKKQLKRDNRGNHKPNEGKVNDYTRFRQREKRAKFATSEVLLLDNILVCGPDGNTITALNRFLMENPDKEVFEGKIVDKQPDVSRETVPDEVPKPEEIKADHPEEFEEDTVKMLEKMDKKDAAYAWLIWLITVGILIALLIWLL
jgi:hypothetical protein